MYETRSLCPSRRYATMVFFYLSLVVDLKSNLSFRVSRRREIKTEIFTERDVFRAEKWKLFRTSHVFREDISPASRYYVASISVSPQSLHLIFISSVV